MTKQTAQVMGDLDNRRRFEGRDIYLLNHLCQECRFGQNLQVHQPGHRLKDDRLQCLTPMDSTGREDVADRQREQEPPEGGFPPPPDSTHEGQGTPTDDMVAVINRFQERVKMRGGPASLGRGDEDDRMQTVGHPLFDGPGPTDAMCGYHESIGRAVATFQKREQSLADNIGRDTRPRSVPRVDHDDPNPTVRNR